MGLTYFYDYFAKEYKKDRKGKLLPNPAAMFGNIGPEDVQNCRRILKNSYANYRTGRNAEVLKRLIGEYREYVSCCHDGQARDRYNAFVYRYMLEVPVGSRAIAAKLGVAKETVFNYVNKCFDEMLALCMGMSAVGSRQRTGRPRSGCWWRAAGFFLPWLEIMSYVSFQGKGSGRRWSGGGWSPYKLWGSWPRR